MRRMRNETCFALAIGGIVTFLIKRAPSQTATNIETAIIINGIAHCAQQQIAE